MTWQRAIAAVGTLALVNIVTALAIARPWLPLKEFRMENGNVTFIQHTLTTTWQEFPRLNYTTFVMERTHSYSPEFRTQVLLLGFLKIDREELRQTWPCGSHLMR